MKAEGAPHSAPPSSRVSVLTPQAEFSHVPRSYGGSLRSEGVPAGRGKATAAGVRQSKFGSWD